MRVLVTGAGSGIGQATAKVLAARGHDVIATARRPETLADLDVALTLPLDVTDDASVRDAVAAAEADGPLDALVNNAGISETGPLESYPMDAVRRMFETNTFGALRTIQAVVPGMRARGSGVIVNVTSVEGRVAGPLAGIYSATKFALEAISESLHLEVGHFGLRVVIVEPGYIAPGMKALPRHGEDGPPYDELRRQWSGADDTLVGPEGRPQPELVGEAIADALEDDQTPLRVPVGADAELVLAIRKQQTDEEFESTMRETLGLTW